MAEFASLPSAAKADLSSFSFVSAFWSLIEFSAETEESLNFDRRLKTSAAWWEDI